MWNARIPKYCFLFTFLFPDWKGNKGKETPFQLVETHLWVDIVFESTLKMLAKEANYFDVYCVQSENITYMCLVQYIYRGKWFHIEKGVLSQKKP